MVATTSNQQNSVKPSAAEVELARTSSQALGLRLMDESAESVLVRLADEETDAGEPIKIPASALRLLKSILAEMAEGNAVAVLPVETELTTQQAAELLNVSRPFLIEQLEKGLIPYRKVGSHRRVAYKDVMNYKRDINTKRLGVLSELVAQAQELDMGY